MSEEKLRGCFWKMFGGRVIIMINENPVSDLEILRDQAARVLTNGVYVRQVLDELDAAVTDLNRSIFELRDDLGCLLDNEIR